MAATELPVGVHAAKVRQELGTHALHLWLFGLDALLQVFLGLLPLVPVVLLDLLNDLILLLQRRALAFGLGAFLGH
eukprot:scaffold173214_cov14-Tisochrysis_lutea.AAC.1